MRKLLAEVQNGEKVRRLLRIEADNTNMFGVHAGDRARSTLVIMLQKAQKGT